mgnify:FL=1
MVSALRHQHGGTHTETLFAAPPTPEQIAPIKAYLDAVHAGLGEGWLRVVPIPVCDAEIPSTPVRPQERRSSVFGVGVTGSGEVR